MYKLWFVVNVHSTSCTAVCHVLLGYIVLELTTACLFFIILPVLWGTVTGVVIKVCALSLCMLVVV